MNVEKLPYVYDVKLIIESIPSNLLNSKEFLSGNQLSITVEDECASPFSSVGSLYDYDARVMIASTEKFTTIHPLFKGTYLETVVAQVRGVADTHGVNVGRVRLLGLPPLKCYSYHRDVDEFRYHIPIKTNPYAKFIVGDSVEKMPEVGTLYKFATKDYHSALNASTTEKRIHLVFDTFTS